MKTYLVSIMGKKGIFKKEIKADNRSINTEGVWFFKDADDGIAFLVIKDWILVEEVPEE